LLVEAVVEVITTEVLLPMLAVAVQGLPQLTLVMELLILVAVVDLVVVTTISMVVMEDLV
tara:strand:+ start:416 stop:595 length:180 start_codon:yes stop_codon:yes gene_type:complete